jgi:hypothetical protein
VTWLWTILLLVGFYIAVNVVMPFTSLLVTFPFIALGRAVSWLRVPMWFAGRYVAFAFDVAIIVYLTALASDRLDVWAPALWLVNAALLFGLFKTLYDFDIMCFARQSGPWVDPLRDVQTPQ